MRPASGERNRWTYAFGGQTLTWNGPPEAIVGQIADLLAAEFAVGGDAPVERVVLNVSGVVTVDAYGALQQLLSGVSLIESFRIAKVAGDVVGYEVEVRGGRERLRRALRFAGLAEQDDGSEFGLYEAGPVLEFFFSSQEVDSSLPNVL